MEARKKFDAFFLSLTVDEAIDFIDLMDGLDMVYWIDALWKARPDAAKARIEENMKYNKKHGYKMVE